MKNESPSTARSAARVSAFCAAGNFALSAFKLAAGVIGHSGAMISDGIHSASDVLGSLIAAGGVKLSERPADASHPYGHERLECIAALFLAGLLLTAGIGIGFDAAKSLISGAYKEAAIPGTLPLIAAVVSIVVKEAMYQFVIRAARRTGLSALRAEAWDHRSDALSSVGALIGIAGARAGLPALEPLASAVICALIARAAVGIFRDAIDKLVDRSCDAATLDRLRSCAASVEGVKSVDLLRAREFASRLYVDIEISADATLPLVKAHDIARSVHDAVEHEFPRVKHVMVHVNPYGEPFREERDITAV